LANCDKKILIIAAEAGSSNLIFSYFKDSNKTIEVWAEGVAIKIASDFGFSLVSPEKILTAGIDYDEIYLAGTVGDVFGQISFVNKYLRQYCRNLFHVFDNWVNYKERFQDCTVENAIVFDELARDAVRLIFGSRTRIGLLPNKYLEDLRQTFEITRNSEQKSILILGTRPNNFTDYSTGPHGYECFCNLIDFLFLHMRKLPIIFRPHPGMETQSCPNFHLLSTKNFKISEASLAKDFSNSELVIGNPTYALYLAQQLGIRVAALNPTNERWYGPNFINYQKLIR